MIILLKQSDIDYLSSVTLSKNEGMALSWTRENRLMPREPRVFRGYEKSGEIKT